MANYYLATYENTNTIHIAKIESWRENILCNDKRIDSNNLKKISEDMNENNIRCAAASYMNRGFNVCGNCVRELYKNEGEDID